MSAAFTADITSGCSPLVVHFQEQSSGNPTQWQWNLGNGSNSQQQNPVTSYFTPGTYNVKLVIKNASGSDSITKTQFIVVRANPVAAFSVSDSLDCFPQTIQFTDISGAGSGNITQWTWDFGDGNISVNQNPVHTYAQAGNYTVTLKVINNFGCEKTVTRPGAIKLGATNADFSYINNTPCVVPANVSFNNASTAAASYQWDFGDGNISVSQNPVHNYLSAGTFNVRLIASNTSNCVDTMTRQVIIGKPSADFILPSPACVNAQLNFQNSSTAIPLSSTWNFSDGSTSNQLNPTKIFNTAGTYQVTMISDFGTCSDSVTKTIIVHPNPTAGFTATGDLFKCSPVAVVNFANNSSGATSYNWFFGDGSASSSINPVHNYTASGTFDVVLVAANSFGCKDSIVKNGIVKVTPPQITGITGAPYIGCAPYTANLSASVDSPEPVTSWQWSFGDGGTSSVSSPSHTYSSPGTYTVTVIITTSGGCSDTLVYPSAIKISNKPSASFTASPLTVCAAGPIHFTNLSTGANEWFWIFHDGGFSNEENPVHQFGDTGVFNITLIASNMGCADTLTIVNYVRNDPPVGRYNAIQLCSDPYTIYFRDSSIGGQTYKWKFGDGDSSALRYPVHTYAAPGVYNFTFVVYHDQCSYPMTGTIRIVDEKPKLSLSDTAFCKNTAIDLNAINMNAANIASYSWDFGDGTVSTTTIPFTQHNYSATGTYQPVLITTDILGCKDTMTNQAPVKIFGPSADFRNIEGTCLNGSISFTDSSHYDGLHNIKEWQWNYGDGNTASYTSSPFAHQYTSVGTYNVQLKIKDSFGCTDSLLKQGAVIITDPVADFSLASPIKCSLNAVQLNNQSNGLNLNYTWDFGDGVISSDINPAHTFTTVGTYDIRLFVTDRFGCKDTIVKQQLIADPFASFIASDTFSTCPPLLVNLSNQSSHFINSEWNFGDGSSSTNNNASHYYTTPGIYQLKLYVNGNGNCKDSASKTIILKGPTGSFTFNPATVCTNAGVSFNATSNGNNSFIWDFSDGITNATHDSIVTHSYDVPGFYQPKLILVDSTGCQVPVTTPDTIKVLGVKARIGWSGNIFCDSITTQFLDSSIAFNDHPSLYQWSFGDGGSSTAANPFHTYHQPGRYDVRLIVTTQSGCIDSVQLADPVIIVSSPQIAINNRAALCLNDTIGFHGQLLAPDTSIIKWEWDLGNGSISTDQNPSASYTSAGNPLITAIATNSSGCSDTATTMILVHPLPNVKAGTDTMICRGHSYILQPTGAASYMWQNDPTLSCTNCAGAVASPVTDKTYYLKGISQFGCEASDSVTISVMQPFTMKVSGSDTLCAGDNIQLIANGASKYQWYPATGLSNATASNPVASPASTTDYMVIGSDVLNCFSDTGYVKLSVFPIPQFNITDHVITLAAGSTATIGTTSSPDITHWKWYPARDLNCADCPAPVVTAKDNITYRAEAWNDGGCATTDKVTISVICNDGNVFIPNTFSPNNDGMNDVFYVRGKGINSVKSMKIFNRWGELVFEKNEFNANDINAGWNGTYKNTNLTPDVYVYIVDVVCSNNTVFTLKGNVTLIR